MVKDVSTALASLNAKPVCPSELKTAMACELVRSRLLQDGALVGDTHEVSTGQRHTVVARGVAGSSSPPAKAMLLYRLATLVLPGRLVELGSAFGVSGAYLASAVRDVGDGELITIEASASRSDVAVRAIESVAPGHTTAVVGYFNEHLECLDDARLVFIDGNHHAEPTLRYVAEACTRGAPDLVIVLYDIDGYSAAMDSAWTSLARDSRFQATGRVGDVGVLIRGSNPLPQPRIVSRALARVVRVAKRLSADGART